MIHLVKDLPLKEDAEKQSATALWLPPCRDRMRLLLAPKQDRVPAMRSDRDRGQSGSSDSSAPLMPVLIYGLYGDEDERAPSIPTPPICEYAT